MQANSKQNTINILIEDYLKGSADTNKLEILKDALSTLQINDLVKLYACYTSFKYVNKYDVKALINLLSSSIIEKLDTLSLIKVIDLYIMFFNRSLLIEDTMIGNKNILSVMSFDISNEEYIASKIKKKNISKEKFIENCKKELAAYANSTSITEAINNYLEEIEENILAYIDIKIEKLEGQEKKYFIENLNTRFENASKKLLDLTECFDNRQKLMKTDPVDLLDYNMLKGRIVVYENFRNELLMSKKNDEN